MYEINFAETDISQIFASLGIADHQLSDNFELLLNTRLDTLIMLNSINNANLATLTVSVEENTYVLEQLLYFQQNLLGNNTTIILHFHVLLTVLGFMLALLLVLIISTSWRS